jgi:hypothetical protein
MRKSLKYLLFKYTFKNMAKSFKKKYSEGVLLVVI